MLSTAGPSRTHTVWPCVCVDTRTDVRVDGRVWRRVQACFQMFMWTCVCAQTCADMCADMCVGVGLLRARYTTPTYQPKIPVGHISQTYQSGLLAEDTSQACQPYQSGLSAKPTSLAYQQDIPAWHIGGSNNEPSSYSYAMLPWTSFQSAGYGLGTDTCNSMCTDMCTDPIFGCFRFPMLTSDSI